MNTTSDTKIADTSLFLKRDHCPTCESNHIKILYSVEYNDPEMKNYLNSFYSAQGHIEYTYLANGQYILAECLDCGLIYQQEIPNDFLMSKLYEEWIDPDQVFENVEKKRPTKYYLKIVKEVSNLISFFKKDPGELRILDFGMGWGHWARIAKGFGCDVFGIELSKARISYAQGAGIKILSWEELENHQFDFINANQVFEHLSHPLDSLLQLKRALRAYGIIKISVPNGTDIKRRLKICDWSLPREHRNSLNPVAPLEHVNCFNYEVLRTLARQAQLTLVTMPDRYPGLLIIEKMVDIIRPFYYLLMSARYMKHTLIYLMKND